MVESKTEQFLLINDISGFFVSLYQSLLLEMCSMFGCRWDHEGTIVASSNETYGTFCQCPVATIRSSTATKFGLPTVEISNLTVS